MTIVLQGVIRGTTIELKEQLDVADGQEVEVVVRVLHPQRKWGEGIMRSAGAAVGIPGADEVLEEIQRERKAAGYRGEPYPAAYPAKTKAAMTWA
jgi:hypothetical protein